MRQPRKKRRVKKEKYEELFDEEEEETKDEAQDEDEDKTEKKEKEITQKKVEKISFILPCQGPPLSHLIKLKKAMPLPKRYLFGISPTLSKL